MNPNSNTQKDTDSTLPPAPQPASVEPVVAPVAPAQAQPTQSKSLAITTLVIGILAFLSGFIGVGVLLGVVAIVLGVIVLMKHKPGKVMAIVGIALGTLAVTVGGILFLLLISLASFSGIQDRAGQTQQRTDEAMQKKQAQIDAA